MIVVPNKYQLSFFADMEDIRPSVDTIPPLLEAFREPELLPNTFQEIGSTPAPQVRLRLSSSNNEWTIYFQMNRINIEKNSVKPRGENLSTPENFTRDAIDFLGRILSHFPKRGNRLALVTNGFIDEVPEKRLGELYSCFFVPLDFYKETPPVAWNSRSVARISADINGVQEKLNVITRVNRVQGNILQEDVLASIDRLQIEFDINTYQGNTDRRFEMSEVKAFFPRALEIRQSILTMLEERIHGSSI